MEVKGLARSSHLLLDERPMMVLPSLAQKFKSVNKAIAIQHIHWVVTIKEEHEDDRTFLDGYMWCKLTLQQWAAKLCWMSSSGVRKILTQLESSKILITCKPSSTTGNHTKWYRIDYERLSNYACHKVAIPDLSQSSSPACHKVTNLDLSQSSNSSIDKKIFKDLIKEGEGENFEEGDRQTNTNSPLGKKNQNDTAPKSESKKKEGVPPLSVSLTAKSKTPHEIVKGLIRERCDYGRFVELSKRDMERWWQSGRVVEGTVIEFFAKHLKIYPSDSPETKQQKISAIAEKIETRVEELGLNSISAPQTGREEPQKDLYAETYRAYKDNASILALDALSFRRQFGISRISFEDYLEEVA